jgi:hypothetical protein
MSRWWKRLAVVAAWLGVAGVAAAQQQVPRPVGAARIPEPLRYCPEPQPKLVSGPMTPAIAPPGPPPELSLPQDHSSAFQLEHYTPEARAYFSAGGMALFRNELGSLPVIFADNQTGGRDIRRLPDFPIPAIGRLDQINHAVGGPRVTLGYLWHADALEFNGFYLPAHQNAITERGQGNLFVPFVAPGLAFPLGFEGNNGIFMNADLVRLSYQSQVGSGELNWRRMSPGILRPDLLLGIRYFHVADRVKIFSDDEANTLDRFGNPDPRRQAIYTASAQNNIVAFQFGCEHSVPLPLPHHHLTKWLGWVWFTGMGKAAVGPNFVSRGQKLTRGDLFQAFDVKRSSVGVGQVYELGAFLDLHILEKLRIRAGYMTLWAVGVSTGHNQVEFNLAAQGGAHRDSSSMFWHGPIAELQFLF